MDRDPVPPNVPEFSVSQIAGAVKRTLEDAFGRVRVRGEITECKRSALGHIYLSLKDEKAKFEGVIWRGTVSRLALQPENGVEVVATGRVTTYADRSKYQLMIDQLDYAGEGALLARIERLRLRLAAEGLFEEGRKRPLPPLPGLIGVVTSERGAVLQDIRTTVLRRFPRPILLIPVPVQGAGAAEAVAAAIALLGGLPLAGPVRRPDVVIVARGGGSLEDLMAFNEEVVVRAAAACPIPLVSAVGHETDTTLLDHAADRRAPTPTAAAELVVPSREALLAALDQRARRLDRAGSSVLDRARLRLARAASALPDLPGTLAAARQRLKDRGLRLRLAPRALLSAKRRAVEGAASRLPHPREALASRRSRLALLSARAGGAARAALGEGARRLAGVPELAPPIRARVESGRAGLGRAGLRLDAAARRRLAAGGAALAGLPDPAPLVSSRLRLKRSSLDGLSARLEAVSYAAVLERGFALVRDEVGAAVTRAAGVAPGARLALTFADGALRVVEERGRRAARRDGDAQETLL